MSYGPLRNAIALRRFLDSTLNNDLFENGRISFVELAATCHVLRTLSEHGMPILGVQVVQGGLVAREQFTIDHEKSIYMEWLLMVDQFCNITIKDMMVLSTVHDGLEKIVKDEELEHFYDAATSRIWFHDIPFHVVDDPRKALTAVADQLALWIFRVSRICDVEAAMRMANPKLDQELTIFLNDVEYATIPPGGELNVTGMPEVLDYIKVYAAMFARDHNIFKINMVIDYDIEALGIESM